MGQYVNILKDQIRGMSDQLYRPDLSAAIVLGGEEGREAARQKQQWEQSPEYNALRLALKAKLRLSQKGNIAASAGIEKADLEEFLRLLNEYENQ